MFWKKRIRSHVTLREIRDEGGSRQTSARLKNDGALLVEGHDMGPGVE